MGTQRTRAHARARRLCTGASFTDFFQIYRDLSRQRCSCGLLFLPSFDSFGKPLDRPTREQVSPFVYTRTRSSGTQQQRYTILNVTDEFLAVGGGPAFLVPSTKRNSGAAAGTSHASFPQFLTVSTGGSQTQISITFCVVCVKANASVNIATHTGNILVRNPQAKRLLPR